MDANLSLALSMHSSKGAYALLLGSGISSAAGVPTGWGIVLDLVQRLARLRREDPGDDPAAWYLTTFGEEADYSKLLAKVARTATERHALLRSYFEASEEDQLAHRKEPTKAHHAIAALAKSQHIKVILTTNFDRLLERALEAAGITPTVISSPGAVDGALPFVHATCTVVKLHGDYMDTRIKNTTSELAKYDRKFDRLLARVFDEFGLLVCGWSADWDIALRAAVEKAPTRRFTTYWAARGALTPAAKDLCQLRDAQVMPIADADSFFVDLAEKVRSLSAIDAVHPLAAPVAVATLKRYITDPQRRIDLSDLVTGECERVAAGIADAVMPVQRTDTPYATARVMKYEALTSVLRELIATGCYWGTDEQAALWASCVYRLGNRPQIGGSLAMITLRRYPALVVIYAGGIAAFAGRRYGALRALLDVRTNTERGEAFLVVQADPCWVLEKPAANAVFGMSNLSTPTSEHLATLMRETVRPFVPDDERYEDLFDQFEFLLACVRYDLMAASSWPHITPARFWWRNTMYQRQLSPAVSAFLAEAKEAGTGWAPLQAGLFGGDVARFENASKVVTETSRKTLLG
jgi:hypothetical protein